MGVRWDRVARVRRTDGKEDLGVAALESELEQRPSSTVLGAKVCAFGRHSEIDLTTWRAANRSCLSSSCKTVLLSTRTGMETVVSAAALVGALHPPPQACRAQCEQTAVPRATTCCGL